MATYTVFAYALADFTGIIAANPDETTPGFGVGTTLTLAGGASPVGFQVTDDDGFLDDAYVETSGALSTLTSAITVNGITYPAGAKIEAEIEFTTDDVPPITITIGRIGTGGSNSGTNQIVFASQPLSPGATYTIASGIDGPHIPYSTICFTAGTWIDTPRGARLVEEIAAGDAVTVLGGGSAIVRWAGRRHFSPAALALRPSLQPVRIRAGALGEGPAADLIVSPQHRIRLADWRAELLFGHAEFLVAAKALVNDTNVRIEPAGDGVTYVHLLFDRHEIVRANGQWAESLFPGPEALATVDAAAVAEILEIFPELSDRAAPGRRTALPCLNPWEYRALASM